MIPSQQLADLLAVEGLFNDGIREGARAIVTRLNQMPASPEKLQVLLAYNDVAIKLNLWKPEIKEAIADTIAQMPPEFETDIGSGAELESSALIAGEATYKK